MAKRNPRFTHTRTGPTVPDALASKVKRIECFVCVEFGASRVWVDLSTAKVCRSYGFPNQSDVAGWMETASRTMTTSEVKMFLSQLERQLMARAN